MTVATILKNKRPGVETISPDQSVLVCAGQLAAGRIGALIVSADGSSLDGIISERDIAYALAVHGERLLDLPVSELMTKSVVICAPEDSIEKIMNIMTSRRIRHLPVKQGNRLIGIISIGDVLKHRVSELQIEAGVLRDVSIVRR
jgi:CBS domain-containing protein